MMQLCNKMTFLFIYNGIQDENLNLGLIWRSFTIDGTLLWSSQLMLSILEWWLSWRKRSIIILGSMLSILLTMRKKPFLFLFKRNVDLMSDWCCRPIQTKPVIISIFQTCQLLILHGIKLASYSVVIKKFWILWVFLFFYKFIAFLLFFLYLTLNKFYFWLTIYFLVYKI